MNKLRSYYKSKKIIITGHTGFKGSWLTSWLINMGSEVVGISKNILTKPSNYKIQKFNNQIKEYYFDICEHKKLEKIINYEKPDIIFHLAAQSLVQKSIIYPIETFQSNALGTLSVLESIKNYNKKIQIIFITSDKVYENKEWEWGYRETDQLGGKDPYSLSKSFAERLISTNYKNFFESKKNIRIGIARAGNVIGGGDWSENRIVPDCFRAYGNNKTVLIRNPKSTRPWQHVLEPLSGYLYLAAQLNSSNKLNGEAFNFGPNSQNNLSVYDLINEIKKIDNTFKFKLIKKKIDNESVLLKLNCEKSLLKLKWQSVLNFSETIGLTFEWYKEYYYGNKNKMNKFTIIQIQNYEKLAKKRDIVWAQND